MEGFATIYMDSHMGTGASLPIRGCVKITPEHHVSIRSMFTGIDFQLPRGLKSNDTVTFKIRGSVGDMAINIRHIPDLDCFYGEGFTCGDSEREIVVKFCCYDAESVMNNFPKGVITSDIFSNMSLKDSSV